MLRRRPRSTLFPYTTLFRSIPTQCSARALRASCQEHWAVTGEFQVYGDLSATAHPEVLLLHLHSLPALLGAILQWVITIEFFEIKILLVRTEDGKTPGNFLVVSERYPRESGFARTDDIPPGSNQVNHVTKRWNRENAMGIIGQQRFPALS